MEKITINGDDIKELNRQYVFQNAMTRVVGARRARELYGIPFRMFLDLLEQVVFPIKVKTDEQEDTLGIALVDYALLERFGIDEDELFETARKNTAKKVHIKDMGVPNAPEGRGLFPVTNDECLYGAGILCCPEALQKLSAQVGKEVCIIPSSVHEILLCAKPDDSAMDELVDIVKTMNRVGVAQDEVLSDHLYSFDEEGRLYIAR